MFYEQGTKTPSYFFSFLVLWIGKVLKNKLIILIDGEDVESTHTYRSGVLVGPRAKQKCRSPAPRHAPAYLSVDTPPLPQRRDEQ